jgi:hypothetical protein
MGGTIRRSQDLQGGESLGLHQKERSHVTNTNDSPSPEQGKPGTSESQVAFKDRGSEASGQVSR